MQRLVVRFASENPSWGDKRLVGALGNLGYQVGRNTIKRVLRRNGLEPAPARGKRMPWKAFIRTHLGAITAADFFSVKVLTLAGRPHRRRAVPSCLFAMSSRYQRRIVLGVTRPASCCSARRPSAWPLPGAADAGSVIEVADSSLAYDRKTKLALYARAGIPQYVIVNLGGRCIEIYEQPSPDGSYQQIAVRRAGETVALRVADGERLEILADRILP